MITTCTYGIGFDGEIEANGGIYYVDISARVSLDCDGDAHGLDIIQCRIEGDYGDIEHKIKGSLIERVDVPAIDGLGQAIMDRLWQQVQQFASDEARQIRLDCDAADADESADLTAPPWEE